MPFVYNETASGGVLLNGTAPDFIIAQPSAGNGVLLNGTPSLFNIDQIKGSGGVLLAGSANEPTQENITGNGGVLLNGSATFNVIESTSPSSGVLLNGNAPNFTIMVPTMNSGVLANGAIGNTVLYRPGYWDFTIPPVILLGGQNINQDSDYIVGSGGILVGGSGNDNLGKIFNYAVSGGITLTGQTIHYPTDPAIASGGIQISGAIDYGVNVYIYGRHDQPVKDYRITISGAADIVQSCYTYVAEGGLHASSSVFDPTSQNVVSDVESTYTIADISCEGQIAVVCTDLFPNPHRYCSSAKFFTPERRSHIPKSQTNSGAFLPAITACRQGLYLPLE